MAHIPGVLAAELVGGNQIALYTRGDSHTQAFSPWLLVETPEDAQRAGLAGVSNCVRLKGGGEFRTRLHFPTWSHFLEARDCLAQDGIPHFNFNNPVRQHLALSGQTLFRGTRYGDLHRLQLDIETLTLDPTSPDARIILISLSDSQGFELALGDMPEPELLENLNKVIGDRNPDTIEGHNIFEFDLPYLAARAQRHGIALTWGRDGSALRAGHGQRTFKVGPQTPAFRPAYIHGRHIIDTLQQVQRYDRGGKLERYGLKQVVHALGLERANRTFIEGKDIARTWRADPQRLIDYALDDVRDVKALSELVVPTEFYQTQILPYNFQDAALSGPGEKINALMVGVYLRRNLAVPRPRPRPAEGFSGGYTRLVAAGIFKRVVKADVESLYPSIMSAKQIHPVTDTENAFLPMLEHLTQRRIEAKTHFHSAQDETERAYWNGLQGSYKILINSFYGYLAYGRACFNDYEAAQKITEIGQQIARQLVAQLREAGGEIIEVDTDGAYFVAPPNVKTAAEENRLIEKISATLPKGIHLSHDGRFKGMISLKAKNYILLDYSDKVSIVGSSLRSRRDERIFRQFIAQIAPLLVNGDAEAASRAYLSLGRKLQDGEIDPEDFCRFERVTKKTFSNPSRRRLAMAAVGCRIGEKIAVYQRRDGSLARTEFFAHDEDRAYLLRRLHDMAERFRVLFDNGEFRRLFPLIQPAPRDQLSLF